MTPRRLLEARARMLAHRPEAEVTATTELVLFHTAGRVAAFPAGEVEGAGRVRELAPVPGGPRWLSGVLLTRGRALSVIDLGRVWPVEGPGVADQTAFITVSAGSSVRLGVLTDELLGFHQLTTPVLPFDGAGHPGVVGVVSYGSARALVLSTARLFEALGIAGGER